MGLTERYGMMREEEADLVDKTLGRIKKAFGHVDFMEVGVMGGGTVNGVVNWCKANDCPVFAAGVDFPDFAPKPFPLQDYSFYGLDSMDAWRSVKERFNFLFVDGCHCVNHSMCDFLNYSPFVEFGGYCLFHDTALPNNDTKQGEYPQDHSYAGKPSSVLGVREGLLKMGLLQGYRSDWTLVEEVESETGLMGMCLFQKIADL